MSRSPLAVAYLDELRAALRDADALEAESIASAVEEHITARIAERGAADEDAIAEILRELGPVDRIVANADQGPDSPTYAPFNVDTGKWYTRPGMNLLAVAVISLILSPLIVGGIGGIVVLVKLVRSGRAATLSASRGVVAATALTAVAAIVVSLFALAPLLV